MVDNAPSRLPSQAQLPLQTGKAAHLKKLSSLRLPLLQYTLLKKAPIDTLTRVYVCSPLLSSPLHTAMCYQRWQRSAM